MSSLSDMQIIDLYWNRDEQAIVETDAKYGRYCYTIAHQILNDASDSEESVNDSYLKTWHSIPPTKPSIFKSFLAKIVRNLSFDCYRRKHAGKRGGGQTALALEELAESTPGNHDVESEVTAKELGSCINQFLNTIPARDCDVFVRRYFFVDEIAAIAKRYGISERNCLVILSRTRKKLKLYLEKEGYTV